MSLESGSHIFDYEVLGILGAGGMGKVYKVRNVISDRVEAMKILLPDLAGQLELADRFLNEIKVVASLNHPHIAALHTALRVENQLLMLMEMVEGVTLSQRLQEGPIPLPEAVRYLDQTLSALSYAHQRGVIHRDIKPANMMLTPEGNVKLMDFGIAKASSDMGLTRTGTTLGSLYYISPEQLSGAGIDARSDLYSLGVSAYQIITGKRPFEGPSDYSLMTAHLKEMPRPPIELDSRLPQALNDVILTALAKDPSQRFQTADAFRNALRSVGSQISAPAETNPAPMARPAAAAAGQRIAAPEPAPAPQSVRPSKGYRGLYMTLGALVAIVVIVLAATELPKWWKARAGAPISSPPAASEPASSPITSAAPAPAASAAPEKISPSPAVSRAPAPHSSAAAAPPVERAVVRRSGHLASAAERKPALTSGEAQPQAAPVPAAAAASPVSTSAPSAVDLQPLSDRMDQLSGRATAVKTTIQNLQQQESAAGSSLRSDVLASESRMERYMDEADSALSARNAASAKHYMDLAEREINNLEGFVGR
ncbi:MAG TPA: serine/threonine-protein kinase [Terriglobia bacterium]|nr:serine/threonine-protein kinase [Terriglobia bacterium]